ncbi:MAG: histidine phosphatase family protein [Candidatus Puniceispirillaceae bacterium]|jgi:alpha-ribazole phosphatase|nr:histidine phosphatase family protein [Pseudomonadota bacterium]
MTAEFIFVRHAKIKPKGRLCGRTDCDIRPVDVAQIQRVRPLLQPVDFWLGSPARRCQQSFAQLCPDRDMSAIDARLWEQDFGAWEDTDFSDLPDIGELSDDALLGFAPPEGESFNDLYQRVSAVLEEYYPQATGKTIGIMAHAGVIRAALGWALHHPQAGLKFTIDELSVTRIAVTPSGQCAIGYVNYSA